MKRDSIDQPALQDQAQPGLVRARWRERLATRNPIRLVLRTARSALGLAALTASVPAQVTERVSVDSSGAQANGPCDLAGPPGSIISADGRFVAFCSPAANLVPGDTNGTWDVFVRDRLNDTTERVSVSSTGIQGNGSSGVYGISISLDGRYVAFESTANNLVPGDTNGSEVFLHDRLTGATERLALDSSGNQANGPSFYASLSADARYVAFTSLASNLVTGDTNGTWDVFVRDRLTGTIERVSVNGAGQQANSDSYKPEISADGRFVAFESAASNLVAGDMYSHEDVFVRDRLNGTTELVSVSTGGIQGNGDSAWVSISHDGRFVAFMSVASNLAIGDANGARDVFVRDRLSATTQLVSVSLSGMAGLGNSQEISLSADGRFAAFMSSAADLIPNGPPGPGSRIFVRDLQQGVTELVSKATDGSIPGTGGCGFPWISADARYVAFESNMSALVQGDTNAAMDVFIHDLHSSGFTSLCNPGTNNVTPCPCANQPAGPDRGCDNSAATGGASLTASGISYLSMDRLAFVTSGEPPSATSILLQGDALLPNGMIFGQGVRCADGTLARLYVKVASNGSTTAPDLPAGDPPISARSAQLGLPIQPGQPYHYFVYYRDPVVLGGCPPASTFNTTQTGQVLWWP